MKVKEIMTKNVVSAKPDDLISKALAKMEKNRIHQLPVMSNGKLYGMLELKKIVTRNIDISTAKVENFATNVPHIDTNASVESIVQLLLSSALRAVPVTDGGNVVGIVSESDLMKIAKQFVRGINQPLKQIASTAECLDKSANYGAAKRLMFDKNISRIPITDGDKIIGIVSMLEMIKMLKGKETMEVHGRNEKVAKEKLRMEEILAAAVMRPALVIQDGKTIGDAIDLLLTNEEIIIFDGSVRIVTHKDILELFSPAAQKGVYVQITGMHDESIEFKAKMDIAVTDFVRKMSKITSDIEYLAVHIDTMHKQSPKAKYSIRARFKSPVGFFVAHSWGWKPIDVLQEVFGDLEREVMHKYGKVKTDAKRRRISRKDR